MDETYYSIRELLDYLDGRGIIFEDEELVEESLKELGIGMDDMLKSLRFDIQGEDEEY